MDIWAVAHLFVGAKTKDLFFHEWHNFLQRLYGNNLVFHVFISNVTVTTIEIAHQTGRIFDGTESRNPHLSLSLRFFDIDIFRDVDELHAVIKHDSIRSVVGGTTCVIYVPQVVPQ